DRNGESVISGYNLKMSKSEEPDSSVYIKEIGDPKQYKEIVFCGYGEPTLRWDVVKAVAKYVKENEGRTRLITNGHGNLINKRDIVPELNGLIDVVSISFNSADPRQYSEIMGLETRYFNEMISFAKDAKDYVEKVVMTVITMDEINIERAKKTVEEKIGAEFRVRQYF
ncbi:MAG: TatD family nuclease-associated radical SAM protein, partial [Bacteroidetes bacterium]|nr:TatD family nuclease-associated radical SAM protein [Bacteroidota bacterium]